MKHIVNGQLVDMTESEIQEYNERNTAWNNASADRKLEQIKQMRLERLRETDWMSNSDVTMPDYVKTWRQTLRDMHQTCLLYTSPSPRDGLLSRMPSSA